MRCYISFLILLLVFMGADSTFGVEKTPAAQIDDSLKIDSSDTEEIPAAAETIQPVYPMSPERSEMLASYSRHRNSWRFLSFFIDVILLLIVLYTGLSGRLRRWAEAISRKKYFVYFFYTMFFFIVMFILGFPVSYYLGFVVEHDYGFSNQTFSEWFVESLKFLGVSFIFAFILISILYWLINKTRHWWLYFAIGMLPFAVLLIIIVPVFVAPLFNKFEPLQNETLAVEMRGLAEKAGIHDPDIFQVNASKQSKKLNAYFTGMFNTKRMVLYDNIIEALSVNELKYVMGHEIGHYKMNHIWKGLMLALVMIFAAAFLADRILPRIIRRNSFRFGFNKLGNIAGLPLLILFMTVFEFFSQPVSNGLSRYFEYQADEFGYRLSEVSVDDARVVFEKLSAYNLSDPEPSPVIEFWFYDHPALSKRIENIQKLNENMPPGV